MQHWINFISKSYIELRNALDLLNGAALEFFNTILHLLHLEMFQIKGASCFIILLQLH